MDFGVIVPSQRRACREEFARVLAEVITERGIDKSELAEAIERGPGAIESYLSGVSTPPIPVFVQLCRVLGVESKRFLGV